MTSHLESLIAEMKAAIERATPGKWYSDDFCGNAVTAQSPLSLTVSHVHGNNAEDDMKYIALMCPENARKLIAALEQAQRTNSRMPIKSKLYRGCK